MSLKDKIKKILGIETSTTPKYLYPDMVHVMVDIETMGKGVNAPIVSVGAVVFTPSTGELKEEFLSLVDLRDSANYGIIDPDTVLWWLERAMENKPEFLSDDVVTLETALRGLSDFISKLNRKGKIHVWGNGCDFDNVIIQNAYSALELPVPWLHWNNEHVRTIVLMGREILGVNPKYTNKRCDTAHNALGDAKFQATYVSDIWQEFEELVRLRDKLKSLGLGGAAKDKDISK